jgi:putative colanic acid biosynthesis UDP-glucose lipid carrier transferase
MISLNQTDFYPGITTRKIQRNYVDDKSFFFLLKRGFDLIVSTFVILFFLTWIIPLMAFVIKTNSRGPVFFIQRRVGRGMRSFGCIKFRTMVVNDHANTIGPLENDHRVTSLGKFLRKTSLDELPQFINVFLGNMSIVGPRPHMYADCKRFSAVVGNYKFRNFVRPGITGLAQVKGYRGPAKDPFSIIHRFQYDSFYIRNASFVLDMKIMIKTAGQIVILIFSKVRIKKIEFKKDRNNEKKLAA